MIQWLIRLGGLVQNLLGVAWDTEKAWHTDWCVSRRYSYRASRSGLWQGLALVRPSVYRVGL